MVRLTNSGKKMTFFILDSHFVTEWWPLDLVLKGHIPAKNTDVHFIMLVLYQYKQTTLYFLKQLSGGIFILSWRKGTCVWDSSWKFNLRACDVSTEIQIQFQLEQALQNELLKWMFSPRLRSPPAYSRGRWRHLSWLTCEPKCWRSHRPNQQ